MRILAPSQKAYNKVLPAAFRFEVELAVRDALFEIGGDPGERIAGVVIIELV